MKNYTFGNTATTSGIVRPYDLMNGIANRTRFTYNFIIDGGYAPSGSVGVACSDDAKGSLLLSFVTQGPVGSVPDITVLDGPSPGPAAAADVPLNVYAADGTEPWLQYTMARGAYMGKLLFRRTGWPDTIVDEWEEKWA